MKNVLIVGAGKGGTALIEIIQATTSMRITAVIDQCNDAPGIALAKQLKLQTGNSWKEWMDQDVDIVIEATGDQHVLDELIAARRSNTVVVPGSVAYIISELVMEKDALLEQIKLHRDNMMEAIIKSSDEAISVVDEQGKGIMINPAYTRITGLTEEDIIGKSATVDIREGESMHLKVLETGKAYRGVRMRVGQHRKEVIVNVAPVIVNGKIRGSVGVLHDVSEIQELTKELKRAQQIIRNLKAKYTFDDIIDSSAEIKLALEQAKVGAKTPASVLLRGESGTGKELFAHAIHNESPRKDNKFIRINCASNNEELLEIEMFGYESPVGSEKKIGAFEEANYGSVFLDEIGELSLRLQARILHVLEEKEMIRVNGKNPIPVDVRIITATNSNLEKAISNRTFREDFYYRLNRLPIFIPSLRERKTDIPELIQHLLQRLNQDYGRNVKDISEDALELLEQYHWPGNIRELENMIGRAMIYMNHTEDVIQKKHLPKLDSSPYLNSNSEEIIAEDGSLSEAVEEFEKQYIYKVYKRSGFNKTKTAQALNISIRNLYYKIDKYQLD